jgi:hypothetical protein
MLNDLKIYRYLNTIRHTKHYALFNTRRVGMPNFIMNKHAQKNCSHEIHNSDFACSHMPEVVDQAILGNHTNCFGAVAEAAMRWPDYQINGCDTCCNQCHAK